MFVPPTEKNLFNTRVGSIGNSFDDRSYVESSQTQLRFSSKGETQLVGVVILVGSDVMMKVEALSPAFIHRRTDLTSLFFAPKGMHLDSCQKGVKRSYIVTLDVVADAHCVVVLFGGDEK